MRIFDTNVQQLKYTVLMEVAYQTWLGNDSFAVFNEIANEIVKKDKPPMSCCIYKDRAIVAERIRLLALGGKQGTILMLFRLLILHVMNVLRRGIR